MKRSVFLPLCWIALSVWLPVRGQATAHAAAAVTNAPNPVLARLLRGIEHDQKPVWLFPLHAAEGQHWRAVIPFVAATTALIELDPHDAPYFRRTTRFEEFNEDFSSVNTGLAIGLFPVGFYVAGVERHSSYAEQSALLAGEALVDAEIVSEVMKNVDRRLRPRQIPPNGDFGDTWFRQGGGLLISNGSFPSGHSIGSFAVATVIADRYRRHHWVPWLAYGMAALIGGSRITLQAHFPSDVFAGGVLGYAIGHFVVMRRDD